VTTPPSGQAKSFRFRRREHLKRRDDINRVFKKGRSVTCPGAKLFYLDNSLSYNRIVFTFARKYGTAVERNRAKRLGREAYRLLCGGIKGGFDLVLLVYPPSGQPEQGRDLSGRMKQLKALMARAGLG
jgi:ribonuclease P protein component